MPKEKATAVKRSAKRIILAITKKKRENNLEACIFVDVDPGSVAI